MRVRLNSVTAAGTQMGFQVRRMGSPLRSSTFAISPLDELVETSGISGIGFFQSSSVSHQTDCFKTAVKGIKSEYVIHSYRATSLIIVSRCSKNRDLDLPSRIQGKTILLLCLARSTMGSFTRSVDIHDLMRD